MPAAVMTSASSPKMPIKRGGDARRLEARGSDLGQRAELGDRQLRIVAMPSRLDVPGGLFEGT